MKADVVVGVVVWSAPALIIRYYLLKEKRRELTSYRGKWRVLIARKALFESFLQPWENP
jgi:hypothetical protein